MNKTIEKIIELANELHKNSEDHDTKKVADEIEYLAHKLQEEIERSVHKLQNELGVD